MILVTGNAFWHAIYYGAEVDSAEPRGYSSFKHLWGNKSYYQWVV